MEYRNPPVPDATQDNDSARVCSPETVQELSGRKQSVLYAALPALLLVLAVLLPFLNKAFTMDDTVFMREALHALSDPLHPTAFNMVWTYELERLSTIIPTGPFMAWLLLPAAALGGAEWAAHAMQIVMLMIACVATVSLAVRLGLATRWAAAAGLLLAASPAVLGMAGTAMPDVPAMAFGIAGIERMTAWHREQRLRDAALAAVLLACGALTRSHVLLLLAPAALLCAGDVFDYRGWFRSGWRIYVPLLVVPLLVCVVLFVTRDPAAQGGTLAGSLKSLSSLRNVPSNAVAFAVHLALSIGFTFPCALLYYREILRSPAILAAGTVLSAALLWLAHQQCPLCGCTAGRPERGSSCSCTAKGCCREKLRRTGAPGLDARTVDNGDVRASSG